MKAEAKAYATTARLARKAVGGGGKLEACRLPNADAEALRWLWNDFGGQIGLRSSFGDQMDRLAGLSFGGKVAKCQVISDDLTDDGHRLESVRIRDYMPRPEVVRAKVAKGVEPSHMHLNETRSGFNDFFARLTERETLQDIRRSRIVLHRLQAMIANGDGWAVTVLHRIYGPRPPGVDHSGIFGEVAAIVEYVDEVEAQRIVMAHELATARLARWRIPTGSDREESVFDQALREVTTGDVIRAGVAPLHDCRRRKDETTSSHQKRLDSVRGDVDRWAQPIRHQAIEMLIRASNAFRATAAVREAA